MKIILMGNQLFGESTLKKFHEETTHDVVAVYCMPDEKNKSIDPVKNYALNNDIPLFQPSNFKEQRVLDQLKSHDADLCVMSYVTIFLPEIARNIPKYGSICFHPSLLPLHRGPSSINWPIINGESKTGLTIFYPNNNLDQGDILLQKEVIIGPDDTLGDVYFSKIFPLGVNACVEAADLIANDNAISMAQNETKATYETWCKKSDTRINWNNIGIEVYNLIRGSNPQPGAWAKFKDKEFTFFDTRFKKENTNFFPGQIISIKKESIDIAVKEGVLSVSRLKSYQGKLFIKDMNMKIFSEGELFS